MVRRSLPRSKGISQPASRRHRRAPSRLQHVRYSEKILESQGISIETLDLSEVLGRIDRMKRQR